MIQRIAKGLIGISLMIFLFFTLAIPYAIVCLIDSIQRGDT